MAKETSKDIIEQYRSLVKSNDSIGLRELYACHPIDVSDWYLSVCKMPGCECGERISVESYLQSESQKGFPNTRFTIDTTYETFKILVEIGMLKSTNMKFLFSYFKCPCEQQFERVCEIFDLFDKNAIKEYQDEYQQTIFRACLMTWCISTKEAQIEVLNKILACGVKMKQFEDNASDYEILKEWKLDYDSKTNTVFHLE